MNKKSLTDILNYPSAGEVERLVGGESREARSK